MTAPNNPQAIKHPLLDNSEGIFKKERMMGNSLQEVVAKGLQERFLREVTSWAGLAQAAILAIEGEGWCVVPRVPSDEMLSAVQWQIEECTDGFTYRAPCAAEHVWDAMIQASGSVDQGSVASLKSEPSPTVDSVASETGEG